MEPMNYYPTLSLIIAASLAACAPTVRLQTPEPVKIDVAMKVDVYTHQQASSGETSAETQRRTPRERRRFRMSEVQNLKNDRIIGEAADGFLKLRKTHVDPVYADYATRIITEENNDRAALFAEKEKEENKPIMVIAREFAKRARESSFPGEWIETESGEWIEK